MEIFPQIIGWTGTALIVLGYFLVSTKRIEPTSRVYQYINILGAVDLGYSAYAQAAWPNFGLQIVWLLIGLYSLYKIARHVGTRDR